MNAALRRQLADYQCEGNLLSGVHEPESSVIAEVVLLDAHVDDGKFTPRRAKVNSRSNMPRASR
ncbi:MAG: hypothetical protein ABIQ47_11315 [Tepidiformaceae bacterium]